MRLLILFLVCFFPVAASATCYDPIIVNGQRPASDYFQNLDEILIAYQSSSQSGLEPDEIRAPLRDDVVQPMLERFVRDAYSACLTDSKGPQDDRIKFASLKEIRTPGRIGSATLIIFTQWHGDQRKVHENIALRITPYRQAPDKPSESFKKAALLTSQRANVRIFPLNDSEEEIRARLESMLAGLSPY